MYYYIVYFDLQFRKYIRNFFWVQIHCTIIYKFYIPKSYGVFLLNYEYATNLRSASQEHMDQNCTHRWN